MADSRVAFLGHCDLDGILEQLCLEHIILFTSRVYTQQTSNRARTRDLFCPSLNIFILSLVW